jgi:NAD(P)-dependent dehydrogenase (short-subunit alcohol dehydrogenase family)
MTARNPAKGEQALKDNQARSPQGTLSFIQLDVTNDTSISEATKRIESEFGRVDVLINNAGIANKVSPGSITRDGLKQQFDTNVYGPILLTQALAPLLRKSKDPRVINVSSGLGSIAKRLDLNDEYYSVNANEAYRVTKAALNMVTANQAAEFSDFRAKVFSYCPGFVVTDLTGKEDRQWREDAGADSPETSARGIVEIVEGKRDGETDKFIQRYGKQMLW